MEENESLEDSATLLEVRAAILLAAATGIMEYLMGFEPAKHTRRYRKLAEESKNLNKLFDLYPLVWEYDIVNLGLEFFNKEHEDRLQEMFSRGLKVIPPEAPNELKKVVFEERWKRGDVLRLNGTTIIIHTVKNDEYDFIDSKENALWYSKAIYSDNPLFHKWKRVFQLGENVTDKELRHYIMKGI